MLYYVVLSFGFYMYIKIKKEGRNFICLTSPFALLALRE